MLDLIKKGNDIDIQNSLGGGVLINGKIPVTEDSLRDMLYPIEMNFVFPSQFEPDVQIGGKWESVAKNVSLPLGNDLQVITKNGWNTANIIENDYSLFWRRIDGEVMGNYNVTVQRVSVSSLNGYTVGRNTNLDEYTPTLAPSNLYADLTSATNTQIVSIWKRLK